MSKAKLAIVTAITVFSGQHVFSQVTIGGTYPVYDYPFGENIFEVYVNTETRAIVVMSPDGTFNQDISSSDIANLRQSDQDLDPDGIDGNDSFVRYNGIWSNTDEQAYDFLPSSIDRDGSLHFSEQGHYSMTVGEGGITRGPLYGPLEVCFSNCAGENYGDRNSFFYGTETVVDPLTKTLKNEILIAYSDDAFDYAVSKGYDVILRDINLTRLGSFAAPEGWAITADEVRGSTGSTLISSNAGNVSVANGSLRVSPSNSSSAPGTTISSSDGTLILGDSGTHRTIVRGTLEVQDPTAPSHAANKRYVDGATSLAMAMSSLPVSPVGGPYLGIAAGTLGGETAFALGFSHTEPATGFQFKFNLGHSASSGTGGAIGFGIGF